MTVRTLALIWFIFVTSMAQAADLSEIKKSVVQISIGEHFRPFSDDDIVSRQDLARRSPGGLDEMAQKLNLRTELHRLFLSLLPDRPLMPYDLMQYGSGIIVGDGSYILTNWHVIESFLKVAEAEVKEKFPRASRKKIKTEVGKMTLPIEVTDQNGDLIFFPGKNALAHVLHYEDSFSPDELLLDRLTDLAILKIGKRVGQPLPLSPRQPKAGEKVYALGYKSGAEAKIQAFSGRVVALPELPNEMPKILRAMYVQQAIDAEVKAFDGFSGGALVAEDGTLLGMSAVHEKGPPAKTYGVSALGIYALLKQAKIWSLLDCNAAF